MMLYQSFTFQYLGRVTHVTEVVYSRDLPFSRRLMAYILVFSVYKLTKDLSSHSDSLNSSPPTSQITYELCCYQPYEVRP